MSTGRSSRDCWPHSISSPPIRTLRGPPARRGASAIGRGGKLGLGDALIAAVARGMDATIVTRNRPDFERQGASVLAY